MHTRHVTGRPADGRSAFERRPRSGTIRLKVLAAAGALIAVAACSNPLAVPEAPESVEHTTSSTNHTTSSGNHTTSSGNVSPGGR